MKRWISLALSLLLIVNAAAAFAENDTLMDKFYQQAVKESAYRGTVTFTVIGDRSAAFPDEVWPLLKSLLPNLTLTLEHTTQRNRDEGEADVTFALSGQPSAKISYLYDEKLTGIASDLLNPDTIYAAGRNWNWLSLLSADAGAGEGWPPVWKLLLNGLNASDAWKERCRPLLEKYETMAASWMNGFASVSTGMEGDKAYSELSCKIPVQEVKEEIKELLRELYQDEPMLSLLKEIASPEEAAAYLEPASQDTILASLDQLNLEGNVEIVRRHDSSGTTLLDRIAFPFAQDALLTRLSFSVSPVEGAQEWRVTGAAKDGSEFDISCEEVSPGAYTGSVALLVPVAAESASFVVSDGAPELRPVGFDYSFNWDQGEEAYSLADDKSTQTIRGSLMLRPRGETDWPMQMLSLNAELSSGSSKQSPTHLDGILSWMDMESGAAITVQLTSRTVSPFAYTVVSEAEDVIRVDEMTGGQRSALWQEWTEKLAQFFAAALIGGAAGARE